MAFAGASFGGLVAAHAVLRSPDLSWSSLTLIAPAIDVRWNLTLRAQALAGAALARAAPDRRLIPAVPPERLSDDKDAVEEYARDPLVTVANVRAKAGVRDTQRCDDGGGGGGGFFWFCLLVFFGARVASIVDASRPFADLRLLLLPPHLPRAVASCLRV